MQGFQVCGPSSSMDVWLLYLISHSRAVSTRGAYHYLITSQFDLSNLLYQTWSVLYIFFLKGPNSLYCKGRCHITELTQCAHLHPTRLCKLTKSPLFRCSCPPLFNCSSLVAYGPVRYSTLTHFLTQTTLANPAINSIS